MPPAKFGFGAPARRKEDDALVRGAGRYVADCAPAGALHAVVLRSPHAHARFRITDVARAKGMLGVALVLTAADIASFGDLPCQGLIPDTKVAVPPYPILAREEVRHVGDAVAFVVADSLDAARDAAEAIAIEWTALPHVVGATAALAPNAPPVWLKAIAPDGNLAFETVLGDAKTTARAFAAAAHTVSLTLRNQRLVTNYLDTRGVVAEYDGDRITLTLSSQGSHSVRDVLCAEVFKIEPEKMRVVTPDVGGGFGTKLFVYREYALAGIAAQRLKRPVKWVAERSEHFLGDARGATTSRPPSSRSTATGGFSRSISTFSPTWAPICPSTHPSFHSSAPACRRASTTFPLAMCACAVLSPTPCRSMPTVAPAAPRPPT
jgi:aerobic carbon-monoxide dehydrogenase large subunit